MMVRFPIRTSVILRGGIEIYWMSNDDIISQTSGSRSPFWRIKIKNRSAPTTIAVDWSSHCLSFEWPTCRLSLLRLSAAACCNRRLRFSTEGMLEDCCVVGGTGVISREHSSRFWHCGCSLVVVVASFWSIVIIFLTFVFCVIVSDGSFSWNTGSFYSSFLRAKND